LQDYFKGITAPMQSKTKRLTLEKGSIKSLSLSTNTINLLDNIAFASDNTTSPKTHILYNNSLDSNISLAFDISSLSKSSLASNSSLESTYLALTPLKLATLEPTTLESKVITSNSTLPYLPPLSKGLGYSISCTQHLLADNTSFAVNSLLSEYTDFTYIDTAIPLLPLNKPLIPRKFKDITNFYKDLDALLIIANILANKVRYYRKIADFDNSVCLIKNITKGLDAIKKTRDLMLNMHFDKLREGFKKQFVGAKTLEV
jgi:hypothetical protein